MGRLDRLGNSTGEGGVLDQDASSGSGTTAIYQGFGGARLSMERDISAEPKRCWAPRYISMDHWRVAETLRHIVGSKL
jgi:hypothetical protein